MTVNPFDLKSALLAKHAQHVVTGVLAWQLQLEGERLRGNLRLNLGFGERRTDPSSLNRKLARKNANHTISSLAAKSCGGEMDT